MKDQLRHKTILTNKTENYTRILLKIYVCNIYNSKFVSLLPNLLQCRIALTSGFTCLIESLGQVCRIISEWNILKRYKEKEEPVENLQKQNFFFFSTINWKTPIRRIIIMKWQTMKIKFIFNLKNPVEKPRNFQVQFGFYCSFTTNLPTYYILLYVCTHVCLHVCILHAVETFLFGVERILQKQIKPIKQHSLAIREGIWVPAIGWLGLLFIRSFVCTSVCLFACLCVHS